MSLFRVIKIGYKWFGCNYESNDFCKIYFGQHMLDVLDVDIGYNFWKKYTEKYMSGLWMKI